MTGINKELPCIKDKCLKWPVCQNKRSIICTTLTDSLSQLEVAERWIVLNRVFKNLYYYNTENYDYKP